MYAYTKTYKYKLLALTCSPIYCALPVHMLRQVLGPIWSQLGSNLALKIHPKLTKKRCQIYMFLNFDFGHLFGRIWDLSWHPGHPKNLKKLIVFLRFLLNSLDALRYPLGHHLELKFGAFLEPSWSQVGPKIGSKIDSKI